jgi:hypothetical protein
MGGGGHGVFDLEIRFEDEGKEVLAWEIGRRVREGNGEEVKEKEGEETNVNEPLSTLFRASLLDEPHGWSSKEVKIGGVHKVRLRIDREGCSDRDVPNPDQRKKIKRDERSAV